MTNPDFIGEFQAFYYQIGDYDHDTSTPPPADDATILADANWKDLCVVSTDITNTFAEHVFNDTCSPDIEEVAPGRRQYSAAVEVNVLRLPDADVANWHDAMDTRKIIALLMLTSERTDTETYGWIGNFVATQDDSSWPQEGAMTESYTFRPAARSVYSPVVRRIYGTGAGTLMMPTSSSTSLPTSIEE